MPPQVIPPEPLQKAQERGLCKYAHLTIQATIPPGRFRFEITPPEKVFCCRNFCLVFGDLSPAGISPDFIIIHYSGQVKRHEDPWIYSIVSQPYPLTDTITHVEPHILIVVNNTGATQTFDVTLHWMEFDKRDDWDKYRAMVEEPHKMVTLLKLISDRLLKLVGG